MARTLFLTGASGFIGQRTLPRLVDAGHELRCLTRSPREDRGAITWVEGDLTRPETYASALEGADAVVHLGALTGKAPADEHLRVNQAGTEALARAAAAAGVERFVFVSTIAARYPETRAYPYARAKAAAEATVRASDLAWTILRPTIVLGPASPLYGSLAGLAKAPVTPVFGDGRTRIQPIHVQDVADAVVDTLDDPETVRQAIDLGGPDVLTFDGFMKKLRAAQGKGEGPLLHLPVGLATFALSLLEPVLLPVLPVTAGQLYAFRYDGLAEATPFLQARLPKMANLDDQIAQSGADG